MKGFKFKILIKTHFLRENNNINVAFSKNHSKFQSLSHNPYPISDQNSQNPYPISDKNGSKTIHLGAAHTSLNKGVRPARPGGGGEGEKKYNALCCSDRREAPAVVDN